MTNKHLQSSDMSYWTHFKHAYYNGGLQLWYALSSFIHGLFPSLLPQHAARGIIRMYLRFQSLPHLVVASKEEADAMAEGKKVPPMANWLS